MSPKFIRGFLQLVGLVTLLAMVAGCAVLPFLPQWLQVEDRLERADYIVALAGDDHRVIKAAELYGLGYAPKILISSEKVLPRTRLTEFREKMGYREPAMLEMRMALLRHLNVPEMAVEIFGTELLSTVDEAETLAAYLKEEIKTIILVTSPFHARRAKMTFSKAVPSIRFILIPTDEYRLPARWWQQRESAVLGVIEAAKVLYFLSGFAFRSSDEKRYVK